MDNTLEKRDQVSEHDENKTGDHVAISQLLPLPQSLSALSPEELSKLGRRATFKMDIVIMPILVIMFILNYLDRQNIASARLAGLEEDLGLSDVQYQTSVSILFVGYILMQVPSNMIAGKISWPGLYICLGMAVWGAISAIMASVHNFAGLLVARLFIGIIESVFFPGAVYLLSLFYNRQQFALRTAILFSGSQLGNAFGGLFAIGILRLDGAHGLEGWRWLFLVEGVLTTGLAILFAFILPNSNKKIIGLNAVETEWIQWNYAVGQRSTLVQDSEVSAWQGLVMAVKDPKTWLLTGILYTAYIYGTVANFFPTVVGGLGYDRTITYLLTAPPFILCVIVMWVNGWHSDRQQERYFHIMFFLVVSLVANIIAVSTLSIAGRYVAMMLLPSSCFGAAAVILSWITGTLSEPQSKRAAAIAIINSLCNTPNIWCSYLYFDSPRFLHAFIVNIVAAGLAMVFATVTRIYLRRQNAKLDRGEMVKHGPSAAQIDAGFRYLL